MIARLFASYLEDRGTIRHVAARLTAAEIATPTGQTRWNGASLRGILQNPTYTGTVYVNRTQTVPCSPVLTARCHYRGVLYLGIERAYG